MAQFQPKKIDLSRINNGQRYGYEGISPEAVNAPIEASAYVQSLATNAPDVSAVNNVGTPKVSISESSGTPRFVFENLKGETGDSGIGDAHVSNEYGDSDTDGYTQYFINQGLCKPNLLINGNFAVNQRGNTLFGKGIISSGSYSVDRWKYQYNNDATFNAETKILTTGNTGTYSNLVQILENDITDFEGKTLTFSIDARSDEGRCQVIIGYYSSGNYNSIKVNSLATTIRTLKRISVTAKVPEGLPSGSKLYVMIVANTGGSYPKSTNFIDNAKLEISDFPTAYPPRIYAEELALCQRYYQLRSSAYTFAASALDRHPQMRVDGTIGTTTISGVSYKYCDSEIS